MLYELFTNLNSRSGSQLYGLCPLHKEDTPSFTVNEETNEWYCHGCGKGGREAEFLRYYYDLSPDSAKYVAEYYSVKKQLPLPTEEEVEKYHKDLLERSKELEVLKSFGISEELICEFKLGWEDVRIIVPIRNAKGALVNLRKYLPPHKRIKGGNNSKCISVRGLGSPRYFPYKAFDEDVIYVVEGEKDCLAARSLGLNAVTGTGGSNIPTQELALFTGKTVYLMLDTDATGKRTTKKYQQLLRSIAKEVRAIVLPEKDFVDYWTKYQNTDVLQYLAELELGVSLPVGRRDSETTDVEEVSLIQSEFVENLNNWVTLRKMSIVGTDPKIYTIPSKLRVCCNDAKCTKQCSVVTSREPIEVEVDSRQILQFIDSGDRAQDNYVRGLFGCRSLKSEPVEYINAQKFMFQETASFIEGLEDATFDSRYGVYLYNGYRLAPTLKYSLETSRVTDPRSQQNYYVVRRAEQEQDLVFTNSSEFSGYFSSIAESCSSFNEVLEAHYNQWLPLLGIEGRLDLFGVIMLTYLSVTEIRWKGGISKGWLDCMVIGDTRTGKSQMVQRFVKSLKLGSYINGENARRTGVIGGVQRFGDSWVVTWGAIPMNDRGLLAVDEASGLSIEDFKELSSTRSAGAVTINKIVKSEARARTRLLWLSNPRSGKNLEDFYWKGYDAFREFIPVVEDQARFDLVISAAREDVKELAGIKTTKLPLAIEKYQSAISFAWNVRADDIEFSQESLDTVSLEAKRLDAIYGGGPLVVGVAVHEKIARLAAAIAVLCGSLDGPRVKVEKLHIKYAIEFMESTYTKHTFGYADYIEDSKKAVRDRDKNVLYIRGICAVHPALRILLASNAFRGGQMSEVLGLDRGEHSKLLSELLQRGLIHLSRSGLYEPDKLMVDIVKEMEVE